MPGTHYATPDLMIDNGEIEGVLVRDLKKFTDERGWLIEVFREDELDKKYMPRMGYVSMTNEGVVRGPHEHVDQTDLFAFLGPSTFLITLWDNRAGSPSLGKKQVIRAGEDNPKSVIIPPGVVHAYKNVGNKPGMVVNLPNRLYAGRGKNGPVDEIRHEDREDSLFRVDF